MKILILSFALFLTSCTKSDKPQESMEEPGKSQSAENMKVNEKGLSESQAIMRTIHGKIVFKFYPKKAPITVKRIITLIQEEFYNGLSFHRVVPNFVAQTGDPTGLGNGGSGKNLPAEFNDVPHVEGTVAMARTQNPNSADSQFYFTLSRQEHLDQNYTVFGQVVEGMDVMKKIRQGDKILSLTIQDQN